MKITNIRLGRISVPLRVPFKTAVRSVSSVEDVIVEIHTDTGAVGYGEAPPDRRSHGRYRGRDHRRDPRPHRPHPARPRGGRF